MNDVKMVFRTEVKVPRLHLRVSHSTPTVFLGSCFSDHIGRRVAQDHIPTMSNPAGIVYNPISIARLMRTAPYGDKTDHHRVVQRHQQYCHLDYHGDVMAPSTEALSEQITAIHHELSEAISGAQYLFITWGTAMAYRYRSDDLIVANCHKLPSDQFSHELLSIDAILSEYRELIHFIKERNPNLQIILTVSPVRHIKDGLIENNRSKAHLLSAAHALVDEYDHVHYFASYEMLIDDLRDYRYYADDMVHPSDQAVRYIYDQLAHWCYDDATQSIISEIRKVQRAATHRPFDVSSDEHQTFIKRTLSKINDIETKHRLSLDNERALLESQLLD